MQRQTVFLIRSMPSFLGGVARGTLTVRTMPPMIKLKLKLCCVALLAFSPADSSDHGTCPSSLNAVTFFLLGPCGVVPRLVWVA